LFGSAFIGGVVGVIAAIALALGWREPASGPNQAEAPVAKAAPVAAPEPAAAPAPKPAAPAPAPVPAPAAEAPASTADDAPEFLSAARDGGPDDLKQIKGVGPKLEKTLHGMGIFHFDQIAIWGPKEQAWIDDNLEGFKGRATRDNWVEQAKTLAAGGETEFSKKVDKGGVY
jgi:NADH-quinone oxidoreductase subunit E